MESEYISLFHRNVYFYRAYPKKFIFAKQKSFVVFKTKLRKIETGFDSRSINRKNNV